MSGAIYINEIHQIDRLWFSPWICLILSLQGSCLVSEKSKNPPRWLFLFKPFHQSAERWKFNLRSSGTGGNSLPCNSDKLTKRAGVSCKTEKLRLKSIPELQHSPFKKTKTLRPPQNHVWIEMIEKPDPVRSMEVEIQLKEVSLATLKEFQIFFVFT